MDKEQLLDLIKGTIDSMIDYADSHGGVAPTEVYRGHLDGNPVIVFEDGTVVVMSIFSELLGEQ